MPTLTWLDPPILDDGWGASEISVDHVEFIGPKQDGDKRVFVLRKRG